MDPMLTEMLKKEEVRRSVERTERAKAIEAWNAIMNMSTSGVEPIQGEIDAMLTAVDQCFMESWKAGL